MMQLLKTEKTLRTEKQMRRSFTLIELIVVMAIIMILAGLLVGAVSAVRSNAKRSQCLGNLRQFHLMALGYYDDYREKYPAWLSNLYPSYHQSLDIYQCPADRTDPNNLDTGEQRSQNRFAGSDDYDKVVSTFDAPGTSSVWNKPNSEIPNVSYIYEFCAGIWPWDAEEDDLGNVVSPRDSSWQAMKVAVLRSSPSYVTQMPIVRCFWHGKKDDLQPVLNIAVDGSVRLTKAKWQDGL